MLASETHAHDRCARHPRHGCGAASGRRGVRRQPATERLGMRRSVMRRLVLETTAPFQGLPELVAYHEGLAVEDFCDRHDMGVDVVHLESVPHWVPPFPHLVLGVPVEKEAPS